MGRLAFETRAQSTQERRNNTATGTQSAVRRRCAKKQRVFGVSSVRAHAATEGEKSEVDFQEPLPLDSPRWGS